MDNSSKDMEMYSDLQSYNCRISTNIDRSIIIISQLIEPRIMEIKFYIRKELYKDDKDDSKTPKMGIQPLAFESLPFFGRYPEKDTKKHKCYIAQVKLRYIAQYFDFEVYIGIIAKEEGFLDRYKIFRCRAICSYNPFDGNYSIDISSTTISEDIHDDFVKQIDNHLSNTNSKVSFVIGMPGIGKTTLLSRWRMYRNKEARPSPIILIINLKDITNKDEKFSNFVRSINISMYKDIDETYRQYLPSGSSESNFKLEKFNDDKSFIDSRDAAFLYHIDQSLLDDQVFRRLDGYIDEIKKSDNFKDEVVLVFDDLSYIDASFLGWFLSYLYKLPKQLSIIISLNYDFGVISSITNDMVPYFIDRRKNGGLMLWENIKNILNSDKPKILENIKENYILPKPIEESDVRKLILCRIPEKFSQFSDDEQLLIMSKSLVEISHGNSQIIESILYNWYIAIIEKSHPLNKSDSGIVYPFNNNPFEISILEVALEKSAKQSEENILPLESFWQKIKNFIFPYIDREDDIRDSYAKLRQIERSSIVDINPQQLVEELYKYLLFFYIKDGRKPRISMINGTLYQLPRSDFKDISQPLLNIMIKLNLFQEKNQYITPYFPALLWYIYFTKE